MDTELTVPVGSEQDLRKRALVAGWTFKDRVKTVGSVTHPRLDKIP